MHGFLKRTWAEIQLDALQHNCRQVCGLVPSGCRVMAVVKADGYGHGAVAAAKAFVESGASWLGVSNLEEAIQLRQGGMKQPILILSYTPPAHAEELAALDIAQTVLSLDYARALQAAACAAGVRVRMHLKVDTGMSRVGFLYHQTEDMHTACGFSALIPEGIFTHFASADEEDGETFTRMQFGRFQQAVHALEQSGVHFSLHHCCNSAAVLRFSEMHLDMVRPGIILYGLSPAPFLTAGGDWRPAMRLKTAVSMVKELPAGTPISYGRHYTTTHPTRVATVPIGYADGYSRAMTGGEMLLLGKRVPVLGNVCMDQCMLDVTGLDAREGTEVTVFGGIGAESLPVEELAQRLGTIHYEVICQIGKRVPRLFLYNDEVVGQLNYVCAGGYA